MDFLELVQKRQSDRAYTNEAVSREEILKCLEAARLAPSACNSQPWKFIIIEDPELRQEAAAAIYDNGAKLNKFAETAPVLVAVVEEQAVLMASVRDSVPSDRWAQIDLGNAMGHFCLEAAALGLGTCIMGAFHEERLKELLHIPAERKLRLMLTLGHPASDVKRSKSRKALDAMSSFNTY